MEKMKTSTWIRLAALLGIGAACMLTSRTADAQQFSLKRPLNPSVRAAIKAKLGTIASVPTVKLLPVVSPWHGALLDGYGGFSVMTRIQNASTAVLQPKSFVVHHEAVDPSGQFLSVSPATYSLPTAPVPAGAVPNGHLFTVHVEGMNSNMANRTIRQLPTIISWLSGLPNDGRVQLCEPGFPMEVTTPAAAASSGAQLAFLTGGYSELESAAKNSPSKLRTCFKVTNRGGAASSGGQVAIRLKSGATNSTVVASVNAPVPVLQPRAQTDICVVMPTAPSAPPWADTTVGMVWQNKYTFEAAIVGAPTNGSTVKMDAFGYDCEITAL